MNFYYLNFDKKYKLLNRKKLKNKPTYIRYSTRFTSLISPYALPKSSLLLLNYSDKTFDTKLKPFLDKKILVKQSYMFTAWVSYLQLIDKYGKQHVNLEDKNELSKLDFCKTSMVILPKKDKITTHLRSPMAHKTFSQEQFIFRFYFFLSSFKTKLSYRKIPNSINKSIYTLLLSRKTPFLQGTNILETQSFRVRMASKDSIYFNLNNLNK
uniref:Ribosomal protein S10 n=1 Tax=Strombidium cf. sulcatum TaxID=2793073 RepID=A0A7T0M4Q8_9SPIT|nr:ribosomal protein S10 [Strombidium cf. sulcatum]QPL15961.1 ribosomal protein S10 [Strombidium cf. sulcatum]